jgi:hypothetical protein
MTASSTPGTGKGGREVMLEQPKTVADHILGFLNS